MPCAGTRSLWGSGCKSKERNSSIHIAETFDMEESTLWYSPGNFWLKKPKLSQVHQAVGPVLSQLHYVANKTQSMLIEPQFWVHFQAAHFWCRAVTLELRSSISLAIAIGTRSNPTRASWPWSGIPARTT